MELKRIILDAIAACMSLATPRFTLSCRPYVMRGIRRIVRWLDAKIVGFALTRAALFQSSLGKSRKSIFQRALVLESAGAKTKIRNCSVKINARTVKINRNRGRSRRGTSAYFYTPGENIGVWTADHFLAIFLRCTAWRAVLYLFFAHNEFRI